MDPVEVEVDWEKYMENSMEIEGYGTPKCHLRPQAKKTLLRDY